MPSPANTRVRILIEATPSYRTDLKILAARLGVPVNQIIYESLAKTHGINPPALPPKRQKTQQ